MQKDTENWQMKSKTLQEKKIHVENSMYEYTTYYFSVLQQKPVAILSNKWIL